MNREAKARRTYAYAVIYTEFGCNLNCPKCMRKIAVKKNPPALTMDEYIRIMDRWTAQTDAKIVVFTGGEPTLWPHLRKAIWYAKYRYHIPTVAVATNGLDRNAEDFGDADIVRVSNYGSINRTDMLRLKHQLGRRFKITSSIQIPQPLPTYSAQAALPARCGCVHCCFVKDKVYPCGGALGFNDDIAMSVEDNFIEQFEKTLYTKTFNQDVCRNCYANMKVRRHHEPGPTFELNLWNYGTWIFGLKHHFTSLRILRRFLFEALGRRERV